MAHSRHRPHTKTDAAGHFKIEGLVHGTVHLVAYKHGFLPTYEARAEVGTTIHLVMDPGVDLRGRVSSPDGSALAGARLKAVLLDEETKQAIDRWERLFGGPWLHHAIGNGPRATTTADGTFAFEGLFPVRYRVAYDRYRSRAGEPRLLGTLGLAGGPALEIGSEPTFTITGRFVDPGGETVIHRAFYGRPLNLGFDVLRGNVRVSSQLVGDDGRFELTGLTPGRYTIRLDENAEWAAQLFETTAGAQDIEIPVRPKPKAPR